MIVHKIIRRLKRIFFNTSTPNNEPVNAELFMKKTKKADVVSFDIFDTLISRRLYSPEDLFTIIENNFKIKNFKELRIKADSIAREQLHRDIDIDDIYNVLKKEFGIKNTTKIKKYEEQLELDFVIPRKAVLKIFNRLISEGKKVILVSDMYLHKSTIEAMLNKSGYKGYDKLYLSNEINARKDTKTIWNHVKKDYPNKRIVHVGDNELSDVTYPKEYGIETIKIETGKALAMRSEIQNYMQTIDVSQDSVFWGTIINQFLFNSPFNTTPQIDSLKVLGNVFYGPILDSFCSFLFNNTKKGDKLLFLSREGYYLQQLYNKYAEYNHLVPLKNYYFLASRKATTFANIASVADINKLAQENYFHGSLHNWFNQMLDSTTDHEDTTITLPEDYKTIKPIIKQESKEVLKKTKSAKENYLLYIKQTISHLDHATKIVDLGYSGTIQRELSKMTKQDLDGLYLASSNHIKQYSQKSKLTFLFNTKDQPEHIKIYEYSLVLEFLLSAPYGQLIGFANKNKKAVPLYNDETLDIKKQKTIDMILQGIDYYFSDAANMRKQFPSYAISTNSLFSFYTYCIEQNIITQEIKDQFSFTDSFTTDETKNVFKIINKY